MSDCSLTVKVCHDIVGKSMVRRIKSNAFPAAQIGFRGRFRSGRGSQRRFHSRNPALTFAAMTKEDAAELHAQLARMRQEHRDLDAAIAALEAAPGADILQIQRLKKRKLQLKDKISFVEDQITPDIIA